MGPSVAELLFAHSIQYINMTETAAKLERDFSAPAEMPETIVVQGEVMEIGGQQVRFLRVFWEHRRLLFRVLATGLIAAALIAFLIPKSYIATTELMPPDSRSTSSMAMMTALTSKAGSGLGSLAADVLGVNGAGELFIGIMRSQTSQDRLVQQFDLRNVYGKRLVEDARRQLDENTMISEDRKSGIITISVTDHDAKRSARLANTYVDVLNALVTDLSTSSAHRERLFLEERLQAVKQNLDDASNQLAQFSSKNSALDIQQQGRVMLEAASTLAGQMIAAQSELEGLRQIYTDDNARVRSLNARVEELHRELNKINGLNLKSGQDAGSPPSSSANLPYPSIRNLPLLGVQYADYFRRAKIQETVYELLTEQYELAKVEEAKETPSVKALDPAQVPERKSSPPRLLIMLLGTFFAFAACVVWIYVTTLWRGTDPQDPRKIFAREVLATVNVQLPWVSENGAGSQSRLQRLLSGRNRQDSRRSGFVEK